MVNHWMWISIGAAVLVAIMCICIGLMLFVLTALYDSIGPVPPPTLPASTETDDEPCALFRHLPFLKPHLAWTPLGDFPTPIHRARLPNLLSSGRAGTFFLKREDLASPFYGGNKVRTLQHQLASCVLHHAMHPEARFLVVGSSGSNQNVAAVVHGRRVGLAVHPFWPMHDKPDLDNTLNFLSILSFNPPIQYHNTTFHTWRAILRSLFFSTDKVFPMGGHNLLGILGQVGGVLELAEQIRRGDMPDVDVLYVAAGSACTLTGLVLGVCLCRHLGLPAFRSPTFEIAAVPIQPEIARLERRLGVFNAAWTAFVPLTPRYGFRRVARFLMQTGLDVNLEPLAVAFFGSHVRLVTDADLVGKYGAHTTRSLAAAAFDSVMEIDGPLPAWMESTTTKEGRDVRPWLCGHFVAKVFAMLVEDLIDEDEGCENARTKKKTRLLWQTKSLVQPRGPADEWSRFVELTAASKGLATWANKGHAHSLLRRGRVHVPDGRPETYQGLMTSVNI
ncbi:Aste57867_11435 [Aphanomyces stellatus]|uniref:Aste57867_11435 protein n=1 Tax=Aphanomyces stellatus TaxID=120398 RepID=A0A485KSZ4_9STRA|nr:hypothetical protein As57867_011393 [Aphanomyces stellatus]VFT88296.1 Aste57867_11435 [Aphanomyces stellatus]